MPGEGREKRRHLLRKEDEEKRIRKSLRKSLRQEEREQEERERKRERIGRKRIKKRE
ncbi:hypothetical protein HMPREF1986_01417 [Oribacterium sp. oral taxon 078 str. F0263]|uniref:hypothetical protein n=1 Tax=Oribacterium sp. oral taxon 078 TaxID=652706 RepID=UPI0003AE20F2|nr:hypothetical protein [Oribacterium sp. oral taxon 078]ERL21237.1 hypothetical protein HMPREF1986_01417 [Oribacterium sp. oral taxon 078 str. F0263]